MITNPSAVSQTANDMILKLENLQLAPFDGMTATMLVLNAQAHAFEIPLAVIQEVFAHIYNLESHKKHRGNTKAKR